MVIYRSADGRPGYHQFDGIDEAIALVERLRNEESVSDARIFRMQEVPIEFKTYYRVEVTAADAAPAAEPEPAPEPVAEEPANGKGRIFARN